MILVKFKESEKKLVAVGRISTITLEPGDLKIIDSNGDGEVNTLDRTIIGNPNPSLIYVMLGFGRLKLELLARLLLHSYYKTYIMIKFWDCPIWPGRSQSHNVFTST